MNTFSNHQDYSDKTVQTGTDNSIWASFPNKLSSQNKRHRSRNAKYGNVQCIWCEFAHKLINV